jgi:phage tail sheath protein FI
MATLKGFPPSNTISPSVKYTERDLTFLTAEPSPNDIGLVGFASKGPVNTPTKVTDLGGLARTFGNPRLNQSYNPYMIYAAQTALQTANSVYIVRVADTDPLSTTCSATASYDVYAAGNVITLLGSEDLSANVKNTNDLYFTWSLNGVKSTRLLTLLKYTDMSSPTSTAGWTIAEIVAELNSQLDSSLDGIQFYSSTNYIGIKTTWAYGPSAKLEILSTENPLIGGPVLFTGGSAMVCSNVLGLGTGMLPASQEGSAVKYGAGLAGTWDFTGLTNLSLSLVASGYNNTLIDDVVQTVPLTTTMAGTTYATTALLVAALQTDFTAAGVKGLAVSVGSTSANAIKITGTVAGASCKFSIRTASTVISIFGFNNTATLGTVKTDNWDPNTLINSGTSTSGASDDVGPPAPSTYGIITGPSTGTTTKTFTINADSAGIEGNYTQVVITSGDAGAFNMSVYSNGEQVEAFGNLTKDATSYFYVSTYVNSLSNYIRITDDTTVSTPPANGTYTLTGGKDGVPTDPDDQDTLIVGSYTAGSGLFAYSDPEQVDIDLLAVPGNSSTNVIVGMFNLAQNYRQDCLAIVDPPSGLTPTEVVAWSNGQMSYQTERLNSDYGALYWPWVVIRDYYNKVDVTVPPSGAVLATIAYSDSISFPWYAPAGLTRGIVPGIKDVVAIPTGPERDAMYGNRNAINPIVIYPDPNVTGFVIWGQKTLQRAQSALDRINVRRMLFYVEKEIRLLAKNILFEPNTEAVRTNFVSLCAGVLNNVKINNGIYDYFIKCDTELNPPDVIDRNELRARIGVQPTRAIEFIFIEFSLHRTGSFTESTTLSTT